ncbi:MAG TPA: peptidoglycan bridge formation glycyltransferase FemA/FemB family protein [Candidatus Saccharimonadales bacterium]|nr:peptidoglycan bridge formation glycyltransferase FemA/FemB family protein [Candidatus Saccharimonadales bacterium]
MTLYTDDEQWDNLVKSLDGSFLQSSAWAAFQEASGAQVHRIGGDGWACLLIAQRTRLRSYLFAPYGPVVANPDVLPIALKAITEFGRKHKFHWVRIEPNGGVSTDTNFDAHIASCGVRYRASHKQVNPLYTRILDLTPSEDELLASLSSSTRRTIRRHFDKQQLSFRTSTTASDMPVFLDMMHTVSQRNQVFFHSDDHFLTEAKVLMPRGDMRIEIAEFEGKPIACIVMHDFNNVTNYTYAASLPEARQYDASAILLWHVMCTAKSAGMTRLDLFGVVPDGTDSSHPWHGFSDFKRKFGGTVVRRGKTLDLPLSPRYYAYRSALKIAK